MKAKVVDEDFFKDKIHIFGIMEKDDNIVIGKPCHYKCGRFKEGNCVGQLHIYCGRRLIENGVIRLPGGGK